MNIIDVLIKENLNKIFKDDSNNQWIVTRYNGSSHYSLKDIEDRFIEYYFYLDDICKMDFIEK